MRGRGSLYLPQTGREYSSLVAHGLAAVRSRASTLPPFQPLPRGSPGLSATRAGHAVRRLARTCAAPQDSASLVLNGCSHDVPVHRFVNPVRASPPVGVNHGEHVRLIMRSE